VSSALETYVAGLDPSAAPLVLALDAAIRAAHPEFVVAINYRMLMYSLGGDFHTWICAIGRTTKGVSLRFLFGVLLDDPHHKLRAGSSVLKTWDFALDDPVHAEAVSTYVAEAVAKYPTYKANAHQIQAAARAAATTPARRR